MRLGLLVALLSARPAWCQAAAANKAAAEALFEQGKRLFTEGRFSEACPKFQASQELDPGLGTLLFLGDCFEKVGKTASAWATFKEAQDVATREQDADRRRIAELRAVALEPRLSKLVLRADASLAKTPGLDLRLNGRAVPRAQWGEEVPVDPGQQKVEVTAPGYERFERVLEIGTGPVSSVLDLPPLKSVFKPSATSVTPTQGNGIQSTQASGQDSPPGARQRQVGVVLAGAGLLGIGVGSYFGLRAQSKNEESKSSENCRTETLCTPRGLKLREDAINAAHVSSVTMGVGTVALVSGIVFYLTADKPSASSGHSGPFWSVALSESGGSVEVGGAF